MIKLEDVTLVLTQLLPEPHAGLLSGILFGVKASLTPEFKEALIRSGTLHIVALSGMNITILSNLTATTLLRVFSRKITSLLTILVIIGFVFFVGLSPSVIRAAIMGCLSLLSSVFGRQRHALFLLVVTGTGMLILNSNYLTDVSFQLSFLATLGLILFGTSKNSPSPLPQPAKQGIMLRFYLFIKDDFRTTLAAQIFTIPLFIFQFHRLSILSPLSNVLIGWLIVPLTVIGLVTTVVGLVWLPLAVPLSWISWLLLQYLVIVIQSVSSIPFASIEW